MGLGFCSCLAPFLTRVFDKVSSQTEILVRNLGFFNTHPYMAGWIIGAVLRLEEERHRTGVPKENDIAKFRKHLSQSLGAIGDQMFWRQLKPICAMLGLLGAIYFNVMGLIIFLVAYNLPHLFMRVYGLGKGYTMGFDLARKLSMNKFRSIITYLNKIAAFLVGTLFVIFGFSQGLTQPHEVWFFLLGVGLMYTFLKLRISVPIALLTLILISVVISGLLNSV